MNTEEFQVLVLQEPFLAEPLQRSVAAVPVRSFSPGLGETAAIAAFMFPIVRFLLTQIGLPWLHEAARYSELWRLRFDRWIDTEYRKQGFDPDQAEAAGKSLRKELEQTTDPRARAVWEKLAQRLIGHGGSDDQVSDPDSDTQDPGVYTADARVDR